MYQRNNVNITLFSDYWHRLKNKIDYNKEFQLKMRAGNNALRHF